MADTDRWREVAVAGHRGDATLSRRMLDDHDAALRELALGALERCGELHDADLLDAFRDAAPSVRRRAAELAAVRPHLPVGNLLSDEDPTVVEQAAWACGEHEIVTDDVLEQLSSLATTAAAPLVREAAVAALGAIGDPRGLPAILHGCRDAPAIRRRAVLALAPFDDPDAEVAIDAALADRDWQVRQAAEDLRRA